MSEKAKTAGLWCLIGALGVAAVGGIGAAAFIHRRLMRCEQLLTAMRQPPPAKVAEARPGRTSRKKAEEPAKRGGDGAPAQPAAAFASAAADAAAKVEKLAQAAQAAEPAAKPESGATEDGHEKYTVRDGDDIVSIAITFSVSPSVICDLNGLSPQDSLKVGDVIKLPKGATVGGTSEAESEKVVEIEVKDVVYKGDDEICIYFTEMPDTSVLREYISAGPAKGGVTFDYGYGYYEDDYEAKRHRVKVRGDFLYRTNITLRVRAGLPVAKGKEGAKARLVPLAKDCVKTLQRKDAPARVNFVDPGRYLPPGGARMLAVDSINVAKVHCAAAAIPPANIVQMLARESGKYDACHFYTDNDESVNDSRATESIADKLVEWDTETRGGVNTHVVTPFALRTLPDAASNGVFLVAVRSADKDREDERWWWSDPRGDKWNPNRYRLVCVTDIGLTVRREGGRVIVWATSLMTGAPATNCVIDVYGSNNRHIACGRTDATGLCDLRCSDRAEPFAVIARTADGMDTSFVCLHDRQNIAETLGGGAREEYLRPRDVTAFLWTERGIYRHGESIFAHAILRNGKNEAPRPFPVEFLLLDPSNEKVVQRKTVMSDAHGAAWCESFSVPAELPSGRWKIEVAPPGQAGRARTYGSVTVCIEEFAPPQIRVSVEPRGDSATNFAFAVKAEHLYGGPARGLKSAGAVVFEDAPFKPKGWDGWRFGNDDFGLKPSYRRLGKLSLDKNGAVVYKAPLEEESGRPKAAVLAIGEGTVFEEGGRPARARGKSLIHYYPFYVGATLGGNVRIPDSGFAKTKVACVRPDGARLPEARKLRVAFDRVESVYSCKEDRRGWTTWHCERIRVPAEAPVSEIETKADGDVELEIPFRVDGDYVLTLTDPDTGASFGASFWLGGRGDDEVRAPLANPSEVTLSLDKELYRPGDVPRLLVKAPFAGWALVTTMRDKVLSSRVLKLKGATDEIVLDKVDGSWAPNLDVAVSVVQSADNGGRHQTARAHGFAAMRVRRWENEFPVKVATSYSVGASGGGTLTTDVTAVGGAATGTVAVVTVVDEGIHLLTGWNAPRPVDHFARLRTGRLPLYDLFDNLLPVWDGDPAKVRGVKTGGDMGAEMLGRVSPVPTRRFRPLALWQTDVPLTNGCGRAVFNLPEFVGEVRVAVVAYSTAATGAGDARQKVAPKLVMQGDGPRFAAPGDEFDVTVTLANRSGGAGDAKWSIAADAAVELCGPGEGAEKLAAEATVTRTVRVRAKGAPGEGRMVFRSEGFGERHEQEILMPVRPAVAGRERSGTVLLNPGEGREFPVDAKGAVPGAAVRQFTASGSALAQLKGALEFLAEYPHGCLEQTSSRIFPLVAADGFLDRVAPVEEGGRLGNRKAYVEAGVKRVASMVREKDFVMWPDCSYPPWDREVSLYAAHFLVAAEKGGTPPSAAAKERVMGFLRAWSMDSSFAVSAYACHTLALAGAPADDRMLVLYDKRSRLAPLDRVRLARAFAISGDRARASELMRASATLPGSVKEAAFAILALLDLDPDDSRLAPLVRWLESTRTAERFSWGTTGENAHALIALGSYYRHHPVKEGVPKLSLKVGGGEEKPLAPGRRETVRGADAAKVVNLGEGGAWLTWRTIELPQLGTVTNESSQISVSRRFLTPEGLAVNERNLERGDLVIAEIAITAPLSRTYSDLVVQDLFPAALEPVHGGLDPSIYTWAKDPCKWVMRSDARDDRMLVFSKKFSLEAGKTVNFRYPLRVVTAGDFTLPGPTVEAMYAPDIHAAAAPTRISVKK